MEQDISLNILEKVLESSGVRVYGQALDHACCSAWVKGDQRPSTHSNRFVGRLEAIHVSCPLRGNTALSVHYQSDYMCDDCGSSLCSVVRETHQS